MPQRKDPLGPAGGADVRRANLALVLNALAEAPRSRARIATETGLNKATVSSLVAELIERGLVREGALDPAHAIGRPGQLLNLVGPRVCGLGLEINVDYISVVAVGIDATVLAQLTSSLDVAASAPDAVLDRLTELATTTLAALERDEHLVVGVTVAVPGLVDVTTGVVAFAPNLRWRGYPLGAELRRRLGRPDVAVHVENDANLGALAEYVAGSAAGTAALLYLTGEVGVGAGVILGGQLQRGAEGFAGEVGHMPLDPYGHQCGCGRRGCWETIVGLAAVERACADAGESLRNGHRDLQARLDDIRSCAQRGERRTVDALEDVGRGLGLGLSILVNLWNPRVIVLGGYFAELGPFLLDGAMRELHAHVIAPNLGGCRVELSTLGFSAAALGGAHQALEAVLADPTLVPLTGRSTAGRARLQEATP